VKRRHVTSRHVASITENTVVLPRLNKLRRVGEVEEEK